MNVRCSPKKNSGSSCGLGQDEHTRSGCFPTRPVNLWNGFLTKFEDIIPELREQEMEFDFDMEFGQQEEMEIGG